MSRIPLIGNAWYRFTGFLLNVLIFILIAKASFAFDIVEITKNGKRYQVPVPYDLCDITNTTEGIFLTEFVSEAAKNSTSVEPPEFIFANCELQNDIYPWGFLMIYPQNKLLNDQDSLNRMRAKLYGMDDLIEKLIQNENKNTSKTLDDFGIDLGEIESGKPQILSVGKHAIVSQTLSTSADGYSEKSINSGTVLDRMVFEYVIYDNKGKYGMDSRKAARSLASAGKLLKDLN